MLTRPSVLTNSYYQHLLRILTLGACVLPLLVVFFGFLIKYGALDNRFYAGDWQFYSIAAGYLACAAVELRYLITKTLPGLGAYFALSVAFHVLSVLFLLFVCGVNSPFLYGWIFMAVAVDVYFGFIATLLSIATLAATSLLAVVLYSWMPAQTLLTLLIANVFIAVTCFTLALLRETHDQERLDLAKTRDRAAFQRERLLTLINSMGDAVITTDQEGEITIYNAATLSLLDTNKSLEGKKIDDVLQLHSAAGGRVKVMTEATQRNRLFSRTDLVRHLRDHENMSLYINAAPVQPNYHAGGEQGFIFILRDITKEKSLEEERDEFISVVSHEMRTPVAIAEGTLSNLMLLQQRGAGAKMLQDASKDAHEQIVYLAKLVNDLSTLSRAERGVGGETELVDLTALLHDVYKEYEPQAREKNLHFNIDIAPVLPQLRTSKLYLAEILQNFITNSLKYTNKGSITLTTSSERGNLHITVKDTGIGMSVADQKHMFEKFYRSEDYRTRETSGTGLGLYVCKKLADKLRVTIEFSSRLNHGSSFSIVIPKQQLLSGNQPVEQKPHAPAGFVSTK